MVSGVQSNTQSLDAMVAMLKNHKESPKVRMEALKTLSMACRFHRKNQDRLRGLGLVKLLYEYLGADVGRRQNNLVRKWSAHGLFILLINNAVSQVALFDLDDKHPETRNHVDRKLRDLLCEVAELDWSAWRHNDALELMEMMDLKPPQNDASPRGSRASGDGR